MVQPSKVDGWHRNRDDGARWRRPGRGARNLDLALDDHRLEVLGRDDHRPVLGSIELGDEVEQVGLEGIAS
jgi:hypothetical protein